jgi:hypothetical protein
MKVTGMVMSKYNNDNNNNAVYSCMCLTTAKQGQLQPSTKTTVEDKNNTIKCTNDIKDEEITLKSKRNQVKMYNMKPTEYGQRKIKWVSNYTLCYKMSESEI